MFEICWGAKCSLNVHEFLNALNAQWNSENIWNTLKCSVYPQKDPALKMKSEIKNNVDYTTQCTWLGYMC